MMETEAVDVSGDIRAQNQVFMDAYRAGDTGTLSSVYTDDAQLLPPGADPVEGRAAIQAYWDEAMQSGLIDVRLETAEAMGLGNLAYEMGSYTLRTEDGAVADRGRYGVVWQRDTDGQWRLHRDIWNSSRPAEPSSADTTQTTP